MPQVDARLLAIAAGAHLSAGILCPWSEFALAPVLAAEHVTACVKIIRTGIADAHTNSHPVAAEVALSHGFIVMVMLFLLPKGSVLTCDGDLGSTLWSLWCGERGSDGQGRDQQDTEQVLHFEKLIREGLKKRW